MRKSTRLAVQSTVIGYGISVVFTSALLALDVSPFQPLLPLTLQAPWLLLGHVAVFGMLFSLVQYALRRELQSRSDKGSGSGPRGGRRDRDLTPIAVRVVARKSVQKGSGRPRQ